MKNLKYIFISFTMFSCGLSIEEKNEQVRLYETYFEFASDKSWTFRTQLEKEKAARPLGPTIKLFYMDVIKLDSSLTEVYNTIDSCLASENYTNYKEATSEYEIVMSDIEKAFEGFQDDYEESPYKSNLGAYDKLDKDIVLLRLKVDLAISYSNFLQVIYYYIDGQCGFNLIELESSSSFDSTGKVTIKLTSESIQAIAGGRQLMLDEVSKNGEIIDVKYNFVKDFSFSNLVIDSLESATYTIKGKVRYYGRKRIHDYPFEEKIIVD